MGIARKHDDTLDLVATDFIVQDFIGSFLTELNESVTGNDDELFPFGVMPVLSFGDTRFGDIDRNLTTIQGMYQFGEATPVVYIHIQVEDGLFFGQIAQIGTE